MWFKVSFHCNQFFLLFYVNYFCRSLRAKSWPFAGANLRPNRLQPSTQPRVEYRPFPVFRVRYRSLLRPAKSWETTSSIWRRRTIRATSFCRRPEWEDLHPEWWCPEPRSTTRRRTLRAWERCSLMGIKYESFVVFTYVTFSFVHWKKIMIFWFYWRAHWNKIGFGHISES